MPVMRRELFRAWLVRLLAWLLPLYAVWWWMGIAELVLRGLCWLAGIILPTLVQQSVDAIVWRDDHAWLVFTRLVIEHSDPASLLVMVLAKEKLLHMIFGFPFLWALLLATPGRRTHRMLWGTLLLTTVSLIGIAADLWASLAVIINHQASFIDEYVVPPPYRVTATVHAPWLLHLSSFARYLAILILPMIAPVLIWVMLCPRQTLSLLLSLRWRSRLPISKSNPARLG